MMKCFIRLIVCLAVLAITAGSAEALDKHYYAPTSKLAEGQWVKIAVQESGVYQITVDDISSWGLGNDLSQIHIFGYGGKPLSETMLGDNYVDDLPQVPFVRSGDRILFYAQSHMSWKHRGSSFDYYQVQHPYANSGSYLITNDSRFNDIAIEKASNTPRGEVVTTFIERFYHEQDIVNPGETGRNFLGEDFKSNRKQTFTFNLDGLVSGSTVKSYTMFAANTPTAKSTIYQGCNDSIFPAQNTDIIGIPSSSYAHYELNGPGLGSIKSFKLKDTNKLDFILEYSASGTIKLARLDFIAINYERQLALHDGKLVFGLPNGSSNKSYRISGCGSATRVWDVTKPYQLIELNTVVEDGTVTFSPASDGRREFVAFDESGIFAHPEFLSNVPNQNIHGELTPDMIILAPSAYLEQALRVAELHEKYDRFRVLVLDHEKVFNEFSSGTQDAMAYRRLCKMFFDRGESDDGHKLGYLLLLGCGSYDNRQIVTANDALKYPHLLTWQSPASSDDQYSITTDDYFGILEDETGTDDTDKMNIAVGRMIVRSEDEARTVVDKLENYITKPDYGSWKNRMMFVADDEEHGIFMEQSNRMINTIRNHGGKDLVYDYVYIDAFDAVMNEEWKRTYPDARDKMFSTLNEGVLWWNYNGHANTQGWTSEGLLTSSDVDSLLDYRYLPVLYSSSCDFCRFDNDSVSSGERIFLNANGGAIAVICPARLAYITDNGTLSASVGRYIFSPDEQGMPRRIGDILRLGKNVPIWIDNNSRRFICFGDPAMRLAYAPLTARIETINGQAVDDENYEPLVFGAHESVEFSGKIIGLDGNVATDFNGVMVSTLFGPEQSVTTHGYGFNGEEVTYDEWSNRLAVNSDTVVNGEFTVRVIIPGEINDENDNYRPALINLYAYDSRDTLEAKGSSSDFFIFGDEMTDTIGPDIITMILNDETFIDGSDVNASPMLLAAVTDESGVNLSSAGSEHCMTLTLDGNIIYDDVVNYYIPVYLPIPAQQGTIGSINYQLNDLPEGMHSLTLSVWDVHNNLSEKTITFNVTNAAVPEITAPENLDIYTAFDGLDMTFYVRHNRLGTEVNVTIEVYDLMGRCVWQSAPSGGSDMTATSITWNMQDNGGTRVPGGIYIYRATITADGVQMATRAQKLAIPAD